MDPRLELLLENILRRPPAANLQRLTALAAARGVTLPPDYLEFMNESDGGEGDLGTTWLQLWPASQIIDEAQREEQRYEDVFLFAGNGANAIYGFDAAHDNEIVEGDWIGLDRNELIPRGRTLLSFLDSLIANPA